MRPSGGPLYCETGHDWLFMAEPVNTVTNIAILFAAYFAFQAMQKKETYPIDGVLMVFLLFATGLGSFWWHSTRDTLALTFDVLPGLLFLFLFSYLWIRKLFGMVWGLAAMGSLVGITWILGFAIQYFEMPFLFPIFGGVTVLGIFFAYLTYKKGGTTLGRYAFGLIGIAFVAAVMRTLDLSVCEIIPFGTHFVWHLLLSTAAYMAIRLLLSLDEKRMKGV